MPLTKEEHQEILRQKKEAKTLLEFFPSKAGLAKRNIHTEIKEQQDKIDLMIDKWHEIEGVIKIGHGVSRTSIDKYGGYLRSIHNRSINAYKYDAKDEEDRIRKEERKIKLIETNRKHILVAKECKENIEKFLELQRNPLIVVKDTNKLAGLQWNVYYLHFRKNDQTKEPLLCRAHIIIDDNDNVLFVNVEPDGGDNYVGVFKPDIDMGQGIITFNLSGQKKGSTVHIKVFCDRKKQPILIGQYNCYVDTRIMAGDILFEFAETRSELKKVGSYSFVEGSDTFSNEKDINPIIREFFALTSENYHQVFKHIDTLEKLKGKMDSYFPFRDKPSLFIEKPKPEVMIAAPMSTSISSSNEELFEPVFKTLKEKLPKIEVTAEKIFDDNGHPLFIDNLKQLRTKRFFILIMPDISKLSFSHIQFAMAISMSKHVFIVCCKNDLSETMQTLEHLGLIKIFPITYDFFGEWQEISKSIVNEIKYHLPIELDGFMNTSYAGIH